MLTTAIAVSGFASGTREVPVVQSLRLGAVNADAMLGGGGGSVGTVQLGRTSTIIKPVSVPTATARARAAAPYTVVAGDTLKSLSARYGVSEEAIRWSNFELLKNAGKDVSAGQQLLIPPVTGVVVTAGEGDSAMALAARYHADVQAVIDFNYLRDPEHLVPGDVLVIPNGTGPDFERTSLLRPPASAPYARAPSSAVSGGGVPAGNAAGNRFAYGFCTWYVASRRPVPWLGDAWQWFGQAQAYGWATGQAPRAGAIMVTWESGWGHVALVESVSPDGSWLVSEMNFTAWGAVTQRTIRPGSVPLIGFIY